MNGTSFKVKQIIASLKAAGCGGVDGSRIRIQFP
jgi:hypothetical protein